MDFQSMKRRELQALCKRNNIPANLTNAAMAYSLSNLPSVEGLEELLRDCTASPERSVTQTSTRQRLTKEDPEASKLATRTRCGTRRLAVDGTDTKMTPATRTTRNKASQEATAQKWTQKDLQADFEADMEQSQVSDNTCLLELKQGSEDVSGVSQTESNFDVHQVVNQVIVAEENNVAVSEVQEEPVEMFNSLLKVDFHSLSRRDLQSLCKKNKIPANTTNATMADALGSLETVEGLEDFQCNSQAPHSPTMSEMTSSCARQTWTTRRNTKEPTSSKLITKSCRGSRRKVIEEFDQEKNLLSETPAEPSTGSIVTQADTVVCKESTQKSEVQTYTRRASTKSSTKKSTDSDEARLSVVELEKDLQGLIEAADQEKPEQSVECVSETNLGNYCLPGDSENKKDASVIDDISTEVMENNVVETLNKDRSSGSSENKEIFCQDVVSWSGTKDIEVVNDDEGGSADGSKDMEVSGDVGFENEAGNVFENVHGDVESEIEYKGSQDENVNEGMGADGAKVILSDVNESDKSGLENFNEGSDSEDFSDASSESESFEKIDGGQEYQMSEKSGSKFTAAQPDVTVASGFNAELADQSLVLGNNAETGSETGQLVGMVTTSSDAAQLCLDGEEENKLIVDTAVFSQPIEKLETSHTEHDTDAYSESLIQAELATEEKETPLDKKSMRKLKKMLREKLEAAKLVTKMGTLTLEENDVPLAKVVEDDEEPEECNLGVNDGAVAAMKPDLSESNDVTLADEDLQSDVEVHAAGLYTTNKLFDNLISEHSVSGHITVEDVSEKQFSMTPSKTMQPTPSKTPISVGRRNVVSDVNKENIDQSASKTEPRNVKISVAGSGTLLSPLSMRKLKKSIQELSEKKRPALQVRSENCPALANP